MTTSKSKMPAIRRALLAAGVALGIGLGAGPALGAGEIDPEADEILRAMSNYLGGLSAFTVSADVDHEIMDLAGQKLQLSASETLVVERPGRLHVSRQGPIAEVELFFDGKMVTIHGKNLNAYTQFDSPGTIDNAIASIRAETGLDAPGADLLYADPYPGLVTDVLNGSYLGTAFVNGIECHHLAFRAAKVDWQLWVQYGDTPLPMKYVITSKWMTGAPEYSVRFRDWDTKPQIEAAQFGVIRAGHLDSHGARYCAAIARTGNFYRRRSDVYNCIRTVIDE